MKNKKGISCDRCGKSALRGAVRMKVALSSKPDKEEWFCLRCLRELLFYAPEDELSTYMVNNMKSAEDIQEEIDSLVKKSQKDPETSRNLGLGIRLEALRWVLRRY